MRQIWIFGQHLPEQSVNNDENDPNQGEIDTFCSKCGKDWGYYNRTIPWLDFRIYLHWFIRFII
jgi:hypothetical protein